MKHWVGGEILALLRNAECHLIDRPDWTVAGVTDARTILRNARTRICDISEAGFVRGIRRGCDGQV